MGDYTKLSSYNPKANFNMVRFGADTPITECELNEVQQIQQNTLKIALENTIGNGFIKSGNLIDSGTSITLSNSVVHLNGKVFEIDSLTSTLNEGETIYLDVFTKTISKTDSIKNLGNQQTSTTVTNYLQDTRLSGIESARREQVCYNLVKTTGVANHDYLIVCKRENGEFKDLRPLGNLNDYKETVEGSHISTESSTGAIQDLEILGNTVQDPDNLADIKSVGELQEDGTYKMSILSCGKNFNSGLELGGLNTTTGDISVDNTKFRSKNYIKIKPNMDINIKMYTQDLVVNSIFEYDANLKFIKNISPGTALSSNCAYIKVQGRHTTNGTDITSILNNNVDLQIEEGTVATSYEPYQGNKCDILLPCQLEKVGDVSDRLYYDDVEKAWCIEKNIVKIPLYESVNKNNGDWETLYFYKTLSFDKVKNANSYCISSLLNYTGQDISTENTITQLCIYKHADIFECRIRLRKDEFPNITTNEDYIKWATENDFYILLQSASPQKIVLPLSTQIALNSFFGTTHVYMESGEVEGTIKCKIPKSLGATVQSLNNKTDILSDRIEAIEGLKDSQNMKYETDKGYLVCKETKNGVIDDLKIEGKTLVSLHYKKTHTNNMVNLYNWFYATNGFKVEIGKTYTVIANINNLVDVKYKSSNNMVFSGLGNANKIKTFIAKENDELVFVNLVTGQYSMSDLMILEGDHTQNPPSYFEGLMSVGGDVDKIEVLSCNNGNMVDLSNIVEGYYIGKTNAKTQESNSFYCNYLVKITPSMKITLRNTGDKQVGIFRYFDQNKSFISGEEVASNVYLTIPKNARYLGISFYNRLNIKDNLYVGVSSIFNSNRHQSDKKQILFYNSNGELEPVQELHEWDSIEKHSDNKWYYHKRSGKVVLNGSENWSIVHLNLDNTHRLGTDKLINCMKPNCTVICDKFTQQTDNQQYNNDIEGISTNAGSNLYIRISKSKLSSQDITGFKQWLQANNVTVVYQLAEEEVYELAPLHLDSYANETLILCNSGAISPKMEFSITSHINSTINVLKERIKINEEKTLEVQEVVENTFSVTNSQGDAKVLGKVDYNTVTTSGFYTINEGANKPPLNDAWCYVTVVSTVDRCYQEARGFWSGTIYTRQLNDEVWSEWTIVLTKANINAQLKGTFTGELAFGGTDSHISTAQFLSILDNLGAFSTPYWCSRGTWSYANNVTINDTGVGNVHLAGAFIEVIGTTSTLCTIKVTSANSGNSAYGDFVYINNGPDYKPGWRKIYNTHARPYTISSAYPSGGANGDVWFRYE